MCVNTTSKGDRLISSAKRLRFPDGFLWGAASSHYQVEGLPAESRSRLSDWSNWTRAGGKIADGSDADRACEFYSRFAQDIEIVEALNLNSYRTSFNWPALLPDRPGRDRKLDPEVVDYYKRLLFTLKEKGIKTFLTLFHFCLPTWLAEEGGWTEPVSADEFGFFAELVAREFGDLVDYWVTINEPMAYAYQSFVSGQWPPGKSKSYECAFLTIRNMLVGHARAYGAIKEWADSEDRRPVSFTNHWRPFVAENALNPLDHMVRFFRDSIFNHIFPKSIDSGGMVLPRVVSRIGDLGRLEGEIPGLLGSMDYLAVNYYTREISRFVPGWPVDPFGAKSEKSYLETNSLGWEIFPEGLYRVLTEDIAPYLKNRAVFITENGYASNFSPDLSEGDWSIEDAKRCQYLQSHLVAIHRAIESGVNVKGYLHWSLTDNFEWAEGLSPRFGLVRVAYPTQERTFRKSAELYARVAADNSIEENATWE